MDWRTVSDTVRETAREMHSNNLTFMAGSIAHSSFLSLLPLLLLMLIITTAVGNEILNEQVVSMTEQHLSPTGEALVFKALTEASERAGASLIGVVTLLWGMLRVFRGLSTAFDQLYGESYTGIGRQIVDGLVVFAAIAIATVGTGVGVTVLAATEHPVVRFLNPLVLVVGLMVAFYPIYYLFPSPSLDLLEPLPGTVVAAVGWVILEVVFGFYVSTTDTVSLFGLVGSMILLLVWLYGVAFVLLAGATVNIVIAGRHRDPERDFPEDAIDADADAADQPSA